eukprot:TRINITY_DN6395_c1_g1_i2.p1 TRINITY_DN6395_c1_g1~~TRINITY_DN6395_c1_g1_i2.p1  ORF type:complete len:208 (+),score=-15.67 TRINITY_DN6395_c1_g1_i2:830-1453(+)
MAFTQKSFLLCPSIKKDLYDTILNTTFHTILSYINCQSHKSVQGDNLEFSCNQQLFQIEIKVIKKKRHKCHNEYENFLQHHSSQKQVKSYQKQSYQKKDTNGTTQDNTTYLSSQQAILIILKNHTQQVSKKSWLKKQIQSKQTIIFVNGKIQRLTFVYSATHQQRDQQLNTSSMRMINIKTKQKNMRSSQTIKQSTRYSFKIIVIYL